MATTPQSSSTAAGAPAPDPEVPARARTRTFSSRYTLDVLIQYKSLNKQGKSALLRREGLYSSLISEWRTQRDKEALEALSLPRGRPPADLLEREVDRLRRENQRLEGELAKARKVMRVPGERSALVEELASESADVASEPTR